MFTGSALAMSAGTQVAGVVRSGVLRCLQGGWRLVERACMMGKSRLFYMVSAQLVAPLLLDGV